MQNNRRAVAAKVPERARPVQSPGPSQAAQALRRFRVVFNAVRTHFQQVEKQAGINGAQVWALSVVAANPGIGVTELSLAMDIHQSTTSNLVRALVKRGLLQTGKVEGDRRSVKLTVLDAGHEVLGRVAGPYEGVLPSALATLPEAVLIRLNMDLALLIEVIHADESAGGIPLAEL